MPLVPEDACDSYIGTTLYALGSRGCLWRSYWHHFVCPWFQRMPVTVILAPLCMPLVPEDACDSYIGTTLYALGPEDACDSYIGTTLYALGSRGCLWQLYWHHFVCPWFQRMPVTVILAPLCMPLVQRMPLTVILASFCMPLVPEDACDGYIGTTLYALAPEDACDSYIGTTLYALGSRGCLWQLYSRNPL